MAPNNHIVSISSDSTWYSTAHQQRRRQHAPEASQHTTQQHSTINQPQAKTNNPVVPVTTFCGHPNRVVMTPHSLSLLAAPESHFERRVVLDLCVGGVESAEENNTAQPRRKILSTRAL